MIICDRAIKLYPDIFNQYRYVIHHVDKLFLFDYTMVSSKDQMYYLPLYKKYGKFKIEFDDLLFVEVYRYEENKFNVYSTLLPYALNGMSISNFYMVLYKNPSNYYKFKLRN